MSALRILVPVKRVIDYAVGTIYVFFNAKARLLTQVSAGQTPSKQGPNWDRDGRCQALHEPIRRAVSRGISTNS